MVLAEMDIAGNSVGAVPPRHLLCQCSWAGVGTAATNQDRELIRQTNVIPLLFSACQEEWSVPNVHFIGAKHAEEGTMGQFRVWTGRAIAGGAAISLGLATVPAHAGYEISNDEVFSYTGTVTGLDGTAYAIPTYVSTPGSTTYTGRDVALYLANNAPTVVAGAGYENWTQFGANWYSSLDGANDGGGNPNNTDVGFAQLYDATNAHVISATGGWTDTTYTKFTITIQGSETAAPGDAYDRLWPAPKPTNGPAVDTAGSFTDYTLTLTANFNPGDVTKEMPGWFSTTDAPQSVTGSFVGTFQNDSTEVAAGKPVTAGLDGTYPFDLTFQDQNWARANGIPDVYATTYFGASQVPEPSSLALLFGGLLGFGAIGWCRRRRAA